MYEFSLILINLDGLDELWYVVGYVWFWITIWLTSNYIVRLILRLLANLQSTRLTIPSIGLAIVTLACLNDFILNYNFIVEKNILTLSQKNYQSYKSKVPKYIIVRYIFTRRLYKVNSQVNY